MSLGFTVLGSGSSGNAILLECGSTRILVDAGFRPKVLAKHLARVEVNPASISALVLTHEHHDHVSGALSCVAKWGWQVLSTRGTARHLSAILQQSVSNIAAGEQVEVGGALLQPFSISHDAEEPVGLVVTDRLSGARLGLAYDLGRVTESVVDALSALDYLVLESNHDDAMLRRGPYPPMVRRRIAGPLGHLSNRQAATLLKHVATRKLREVVLAHLSRRCNSPRLALNDARIALRQRGCAAEVSASSQASVAGPFGAVLTGQLMLGI